MCALVQFCSRNIATDDLDILMAAFVCMRGTGPHDRSMREALHRSAVFGTSALPSPHRFVQEVVLSHQAGDLHPSPAARDRMDRPASAASPSEPAFASVASTSDDEGTPVISRESAPSTAASRRGRFVWTLELREDHCWIVTSVAPARREHGT